MIVAKAGHSQTVDHRLKPVAKELAKVRPMTQSQAGPTTAEQPNEPSFETSLAELEKVVHGLEDGQQGLDASLLLYEQGIRHLQSCYRLLDTAEQKIELLMNVDEQGRGTTAAFDAEDESSKPGRSRKRTPKV